MRPFIIALVWLAGSALPAYAQTAGWFANGETLHYRVYWGPLSLGKATLAFSPSAKGYHIEGRVKGSMVFFKMDDTWTASGKQTNGSLQPLEYRAIQAENDYRANKRLTFNSARHSMVYENLRGGEPSLTVPLPRGAQDPFTALYDLRKQGVTDQAVSRTVMGLKRPFTLNISAAKPVERDGQELLRVDITKVEAGKQNDTWQIWLTDDAELTPVEIDAQLKVGSFRAVLNTGLDPRHEKEEM